MVAVTEPDGVHHDLNGETLSGTLRAMRLFRAFTVLAIMLSGFRSALAQIITFKKVGGNTVTCEHTALWSELENCGVPEWYAYAFVGSIASITPTEDDEKELQIVPEEIFHGNPPNPLNVKTSQALCLPKLAVGDRWLFFLKRENSKPIVLDYGGNDSRPVADAQEQINILHGLEKIGNRGMLRGRVSREGLSPGESFPAARVIARRSLDGTQFTSTTGTDGHFAFQPLLPGRYRVSVEPIGSSQPDSADVDVRRSECWSVLLLRHPHARLAGHIRRADGSPVPKVNVLMIAGKWWTTTWADARGYFHFDVLNPGEYVIGINPPSAPAWRSADGSGVPPPDAPLFYPGVPKRSGALIIKLAEDEKRDDINFVIPK